MRRATVRHLHKTYVRSITTLFIAVVMLLFGVSCKKSKNNILHFEYDPETTPTMITKDVTTLISDSGMTRFKLVADMWLVYDKAKEPYWFFPKGIYLERFDEDFSIEATVKADTAWSYRNKSLWQLKGNVEVQNVQGDHFASEELFLDEQNDRVYSDKYIEIRTIDSELKGYGFESNQKMTDYRILKPHDGRFPFQEGVVSYDSDSVTSAAAFKEDSAVAPARTKLDTMDMSSMKPVQR